MKKAFYQIAKSAGAEIISYKSYKAIGVGGLQVFEISVVANGMVLNFADSYFHKSGDNHKVLEQFSNEINPSN